MYNVVNIGIHLISIVLIIYSMIPGDRGSRNDLTLKMLCMLVAFVLIGCWAFFVGEVHNLKSLFALIW